MKYAIIILLTLPLLATTCYRVKYMIHVQNQTDENVYLVPNFNYPDTSLLNFSKEVIFANDSSHYVASNYRKPLFYLELCREQEWRRVVKNDSLQILVISADSIKKFTSEEIRARRPFKTQMIISYKDLLNKNCLLTLK